MEAYKRWVRRNKDYVHSLESLANGLTWLLPERFSESEIGPEAVTSILGVITTINEHILDSAPVQSRTGNVESSSSLPLCITLIKDLETLVEVIAQQFFGEDKKWNFLAITEASKAALGLAMLKNSGYKMLLQGGESVNEASKNSYDSNSHINGFLSAQGQQGYPSNFKNHLGPFPRNLEGRALSALSRFGENARTGHKPTWLRRVQNQHLMTEPPAKVEEKPSLSAFLSEKGVPGGLFLSGEVMFILRPLIYVLLIRKYGARSWFPWLASLALDLMGNGIISFVHSSRRSGFELSTNEKNELKRRKLLWALYLMRDPFFTKYTRHRLDGAQKTLEPVPIVGMLIEKLVELVIGAQTRYTYISGS